MTTNYNVIFTPEFYGCPDCGNVAKIVPQYNCLGFQLIVRGAEFDTNPPIDIDYRLMCNSCSDDQDDRAFMFKCDRDMVVPISDLIKKGYRTLFCCEGHFYEHEVSIPYISFEDDENRSIYKKLKQAMIDLNMRKDLGMIDTAIKEFKAISSCHEYSENSIETSIYGKMLDNDSSVEEFEYYKNKFFDFACYISDKWEPRNR